MEDLFALRKYESREKFQLCTSFKHGQHGKTYEQFSPGTTRKLRLKASNLAYRNAGALVPVIGHKVYRELVYKSYCVHKIVHTPWLREVLFKVLQMVFI
jgi:hypothetical protein